MFRRILGNAVVWIIACVIGIALLEELRHPNGAITYPQEPEIYSSYSEPIGYQHDKQNGVVSSIDGKSSLDTVTLAQIVNSSGIENRYRSFFFNDLDENIITYAATGIDKNPYFANSFLVGFMPFETDKAWMPMATLSMRKYYLLDHQLYGPTMEDIWQNSEQAYYHSHGDCEDHAVLLADWLIGLGYDARVVIGEVPEGGHAWVVLFLDGVEYVLESTSKRRANSIKDFYLARRATDYRPKLQFNRDKLWVNTGSMYTTTYTGPKWVLRSSFQRLNN